jgi:RNA 2',3'-cyclic 3'-phosphodiesterase
VVAIGRAFVAIEPPERVRDAIGLRVATVRELPDAADLRWVRDGWHSTLQFLGPVVDADAVADALRAALGGIEAPSARLAGAGAFPRARRGTVLWLGVDRGAGALTDLADTVAGAMHALGHEAHRRAFRPHVTLARASAPRDLRPLVDAIGRASIGPDWEVDAVVLFASDTRSDGAVYSEVARIPLAG